jgi:choloylglycine hydrolase
MFTLVRDGVVLMGNNEDYVEPGCVWFVPASEGRLGRVNFGFKGDRFAQGSMNEKGLCFDAAVTAEIPWLPDPAKKDTENLLERIMDTCATVDEAEALFRTYNCKHLASGHFMLADASGASMVVEWLPESGLNIVRREGYFQLITNTRLAASGFRCERFVLAERVLRGEGGEPVSVAKKALDTIHQRGPKAFTSYSNIYDLKARKVHVFNLANYDEMVTLDLAGELAKGEHRVALKELFQHSPKLKSITSAEPRVYDTRIDLPKDILAKYLGRYSVMDGKTLITIERGEKGLLLNPGSGKSAHLFPESETTFRIVEGGQIAFTSSETGAVNGFVMYRNGDHKGTRLAN